MGATPYLSILDRNEATASFPRDHEFSLPIGNGAGVATTVSEILPLHLTAMPDVDLRESEPLPYVNAIADS